MTVPIYPPERGGSETVEGATWGECKSQPAELIAEGLLCVFVPSWRGIRVEYVSPELSVDVVEMAVESIEGKDGETDKQGV